MSFNFEPSEDFKESMSNIDTLVEFAKQQSDANHEGNRILFLKLAVVSSVTRFQVFVENILKEYHFLLKNSNKPYSHFSPFLRLNSVRIYTNEKIISKNLERINSYSHNKIIEIKNIAEDILNFCNDESIINDNLKFDTKFPMGKTGLQELSKLFRQINGEDIFSNPPFDINTFNEILGRRHAIVHEDVTSQITEEIVIKYKNYLLTMVSYIDSYLNDKM